MDELRFGVVVGLPILAQRLGQRALQGGVGLGAFRVFSQLVPKLDMIAPGFAALHNNVEMMSGSIRWTREGFSARDS